MGVKGCINKTNIKKYLRRHLSYFLCPTALPSLRGRGLCSLFLRAVHPIHRSSRESLEMKKIHQMGRCSFLHGNVCVFWCVQFSCMKCLRTSIHRQKVPTWSWRSQRRHRCTPGPLCSRTRTAPEGKEGERETAMSVKLQYFTTICDISINEIININRNTGTTDVEY